MARLDSTGNLDPTFGDGGTAVASLSAGRDRALGVALQADGKLVVVGCVNCGLVGDFVVARFNPDGSLDPTFGIDGAAAISFSDSGPEQAEAVAVQPDGRLIVAGTAGSGNGDMGIVRLDSHGMLDPTFGTGGKATVAFGSGRDHAHSVALQSDGKIVVAGSAQPALFDDQGLAVARLTSGGSLDGTFGVDGKLLNNLADRANAVAVDGGGRIILAVGCADCGSGSVALVRYQPDGTLDGQFGNNGVATFTRGANFADVTLQTDGKIVVGGTAADDFLAARYLDGGPSADLALSKSDSPDPVRVNKKLTYSIEISNRGAVSASTALLSDSLPASVRFSSASATQGSCVHAEGTVRCELGTISANSSVTVTIAVKPRSEGTITNTASVSSDTPDPGLANNSASEQTVVVEEVG